MPFETAHREFSRGNFVFAEFEKAGRNIAKILRVEIDAPSAQIAIGVKLLGKVDAKDLEILQKRQTQSAETFQIFRDKVEKFKLPMRPIAGRVSFDGTFFYGSFVAAEKLNLTDLVREFSRETQMKPFFEKIGERDRAKICGTLGKCGQKCCCKNIFSQLPKVSMAAARMQNLRSGSLENITGVCGKLKCCLNFENEVYKEKLKNLPRIRARVSHRGENGKVIQIDALNEKLTIKFENGEIATLPATEIEIAGKIKK